MTDATAPLADPPAPPGLGPLPTLPVFFKLRDRPVVLAGGSLPAVWKAELLAATGAVVTVFDAAPCPEMLSLKARLGEGLSLVERSWTPGDLAGAALAVGALEGGDAEAFRRAAKAAGVPVNIVDMPELCDFQFGTLVARAPLLIAISTDGAAPVLGQALRARIEGLLPPTIAAWAKAAKDWRPGLQAGSPSFAARRRFWETFADRALAGTRGAPTQADREACMAAALAERPAATGSLDLVGLGPGDPDTITLRAIRALQSADAIVHPTMVDPALIALGRREASLIVESSSDDATAAGIERLVAQGKTVVWAALGDPKSCWCWGVRRRSLSIGARREVGGLGCGTCPRGDKGPMSAPAGAQ